jgi:hypothetical protein
MYENITVTGKWHPLDPLEGQPVMEVLLRGLQFLDEYWLSAGTLLGLERQNEFMPQDTDIDLAVKGYWARHRLPEDEFFPIRIVCDGDRPMQSAYAHTETGVIFDVLHWWPHPTDETKLINIKEDAHIIRSAQLLNPIVEKEYLGHTFGVPNDIDAYLTEWYGDWRVPAGVKTNWIK